MVKIGVINGRFQILHLKHLEYILAAKMRCEKLYIGITNPDNLHMGESPYDAHRSEKFHNPCTYLERMQMIHDALIDFGVKREEFEIVPFPINRPNYILQYTPKDAVYYMSICDRWDEEKKNTLDNLGLDTVVLFNKKPEEKGTTGSDIRELIVAGKPWGHLVPKTVYEYVITNHIDERIKDLAK